MKVPMLIIVTVLLLLILGTIFVFYTNNAPAHFKEGVYIDPNNISLVPKGLYIDPNNVSAVPNSPQTFSIVPSRPSGLRTLNVQSPPPAGARGAAAAAINPDASRQYDPGNLNVQYHDNAEDIQKQVGQDPSANLINVLDASGNLTQIPLSQTMSNTTFYGSNNLVYNPANYVPTYEDTVYFSKLTGLGYQFPIYGTDSQWGGFCSYNHGNPDKIEEKCNTLDGDTCAATSCCVWLGGKKCVAGNQNGPTMKSHYYDSDVTNRSKYFFGGRCYGNCVDDQSNYYNYNHEVLSDNAPQINKLNLKAGVYGGDKTELSPWFPGQTTRPNLYPSPMSNMCASQYPNCNLPCGLNQYGYCVYQGPTANVAGPPVVATPVSAPAAVPFNAPVANASPVTSAALAPLNPPSAVVASPAM